MAFLFSKQAILSRSRTGRTRNALLAATALSGGFTLLMAANPQSALAACAVTSTPNTVDCATTVTTNTINLNATHPASVDSLQLFTLGGNVAAQVNAGAAITGFGLSIDSTQAGANVSMNNLGSITNSAGVPGPVGGTAVENLIATGGNVSYMGNGSVTAAAAHPTDALVLTTTGAGTASVGAAGTPVTGGTFSGVDGIVVGSAAGAANVFLQGGMVTGTAANGIRVTTTSGVITINNGATINAATNGINAGSVTGNISVTGTGAINADTGAAGVGTGILAISANAAAAGTTGSVTIGSAAASYTGNITSGAGGLGGVRGIDAEAIETGTGATTTGNVSVFSGGNITVGSGGAQGIFAQTEVTSATGVAGSVTVNVTAGNVQGQSNGVEAFVNNTANPFIATPNSPVGSTNVTGFGAGGNVSVTTAVGSNVLGVTGDGIFAHTNTANASVTVDAEGNVAGPLGVFNPNGARGIAAKITNINNPAAVLVTTNGNSTVVGGGPGPTGQSTFGGAAGAPIVGPLGGDGQGILAYTAGTGSVTVNSSSTTGGAGLIISFNDNGIQAYTDNVNSTAPISVTVGSNIGQLTPVAGTDGVLATTFGTGPVTVTTLANTTIGGTAGGIVLPNIANDGISASILGTAPLGGPPAGNVTVTTGAASVINANHNGITAFANADLSPLLLGAGTITSSLIVTTGAGSIINAGNNGIDAELTTLLANTLGGATPATNNGNINITTGANSVINAAGAAGINAILGLNQDPLGNMKSGLNFNTGNVTVTTGTGSAINETNPGGQGIVVLDLTKLTDSGNLAVALGNSTAITAGNNAVFVNETDPNSVGTVTVAPVTGGNGFLQISANTAGAGGSGIVAETAGIGGVSVQAGTAACANNVANCQIKVNAPFPGYGILAFSTGVNGAVTVNNFAVIDPPIDAIHAEIANPLNPAPVFVQNNATITGTRTGIFAGTAGLGSVSVNDGNIIAGTTVTGGSNGIYAAATNLLNANAVTVSVNGNVTGNGAVAAPDYNNVLAPFPNPFRAGVPGAIAAYPNATTGTQPLTAAGATGYGIFAYNAGIGGMNVNAYGVGTITSGGGAGVGILAYSDNPNLGNTGAISVSSNEAIVAPAAAPAGGFNNTGIIAYTAGSGAVSVATTPTGTIGSNAAGTAAVGGNGIDALIVNTGSSANVTVNALGAIDATGVNISLAPFTGAVAQPAITAFGAGIVAINDGSGNVTVTSGNITSGGLGINAAASNAANPAAAAGTVTVNALGNISAAGAQGILALSGFTGTPGTGNIVVNTSANVSGGIGIDAITSGVGNVTITNTGGAASTITGATGSGILVDNSVTGLNGNIIINANANVTGATDAITALIGAAGTGSISVTTGSGVITGGAGAAAVATGNGIDAVISNAASSGSITVVTGTGLVKSGATGTGIIATTLGSGDVSVTVGSGGVMGGPGVTAASGTGNVAVTSNGAVVDPLSWGISAQTGGAGMVTVTANGATTGGSVGIQAQTTGTGMVTVGGSGAVTGLAVPATGATLGNAGIWAHETGAGPGAGNIGVLVTGTGSTTTGLGNAIDAQITNAANGSNILVNRTGTVSSTAATGPAAGIFASTIGTGSVTVTSGRVTASQAAGITSDGIHAQAVGGLVSVTTGAGPVTGGKALPAWGVNAINTGAGLVTVTIGAGGASGAQGVQAISGAGAVTVTTNGVVTGNLGQGIRAGGVTPATSTTGNVIVLANNTVSGGANGIVASATGAGTVTVDTAFNVTGGTAPAGGNGIITTTVGGANSVNVSGAGTTIKGTGAGFSGISASSSGAGAVNVGIGAGTIVTNATGIGVTLGASGTGTATLTNSGTVFGLGTTANPSISVTNNAAATSTVTINNGSTGLITSVAGATGFAVAGPTTDAQPVIINNMGVVNGNVQLGARADAFNNFGTGVWNVNGGPAPGVTNIFGNGSSITNAAGGVINIGGGVGTATNFAFASTATDTITNSGLINSTGTVNFTFTGPGATTINNTSTGIFNIGSIATPGLAESTTFTSTAGGVQTVNNTGAFNVVGLVPQTGIYTGALNFAGANTSQFNNAGGVINMQADGGSTKNAVTLNTPGLTGTSDLNYTYTWAGPLATTAYNFAGGAGSTLRVDTFLGAPGSTSDRLVVGGNLAGITQIAVNNTNPGPGTLNLTGITVVAAQGTGSTNFVVSPTTPNFLNFGPLGAISSGAFVDPLLYVPGGATSTPGTGLPNGNAYKLFSLPGPFLTQLPLAITAAQNIWQQTALGWEDRQEELRSYYDCGMAASGQAYGGGADLPTRKSPPPPAVAGCSGTPSVWLKAVASGTNFTDQENLGKALGNPLFNGLGWSNSYKQATFGVVGGVDGGISHVFSPTDSIVFGVMGGYLDSQVSFDSPNVLGVPPTFTGFNFTGGTVGVSADYMNGGFFIDALAKVDFLRLNISGIPGGFLSPAPSVSSTQGINSDTWGVLGNIGYRFERGQWFVEPLGTFQYIDASLGNLALPGAAINANFNRGDAFDIAGGVRAGGIVMDDRAHYLEAAVTAKVWDPVSVNNVVNFTSIPNVPGTAFPLTANFTDPYGEVGLQLDWIKRGGVGWSAFAKADAQFNQQFVTVTAKGGVTYGF